MEFCAGADLLVHDAEYTEEDYSRSKRWGHSAYTTALWLAIKAEVKRFGLFHHNQWKNDGQIDRMVGHCRDIIHQSGIDMECFAVGSDMVIEL
jgi:ribonuclease BN (tRNA processing enzyme)